MRLASRWIAVSGALLAVLALGACATAPTYPALAAAQQQGELPPLVPLRRFVANVDYVDGHVLSPDAKK